MGEGRRSPQKSLAAWYGRNPLFRWRRKQEPEGWNRSVLARKIGASPAAVGTWEKGQRMPGVRMMAKIEQLTRITSTEWMAWYDDKPRRSKG
jgi:ribosome-binding protein aMBF1 (putative translation factor)